MILQKLKITPPHILCAVNAPNDFVKTIGKLPEGIKIVSDTKSSFNSIHWFVKTKHEVDAQLPNILKMMKPNITVYCYYPKGTSKIQTDLTRDKGWDSFLKNDELKWLTLISFNETWSTFSFRLRTQKDKEAKPVKREIFEYADSKTKTIILPKDVTETFNKNKKAKAIFDALAFSHKREYIEWIVTAKREETRTKRIEGTLSMLLEGKKNPSEK
jgi:hypothetical protein